MYFRDGGLGCGDVGTCVSRCWEKAEEEKEGWKKMKKGKSKGWGGRCSDAGPKVHSHLSIGEGGTNIYIYIIFFFRRGRRWTTLLHTVERWKWDRDRVRTRGVYERGNENPVGWWELNESESEMVWGWTQGWYAKGFFSPFEEKVNSGSQPFRHSYPKFSILFSKNVD